MNISHRIKLGEANSRQKRASARNATATHTCLSVCLSQVITAELSRTEK